MRSESSSFDRSIRAVMARYHPDVAQWLLGERPLEVRELDSSLATVASRFADKLLLVRLAGEHDVLLHLEFQSRGDAEMPERMAEYLALSLRTVRGFRPRTVLPACAVVYLDREGYREDPGALELSGPLGARFLVQYKVVRLWEEDPAPLLALPSPALCPFVPLMAGCAEEFLLQSRQKILEAPEALASAEAKRDLLTVLAALSAKTVRHSPILDRLLTEVQLMEGNWVLDLLREQGIALGIERGKTEGKAEGQAEGKAEGRAEGKAEGQRLAIRQDVLRILRRRFGEVPVEVSSRLEGLAQLEDLERLVEEAAVAPDLVAFLARLSDR